MSISVAFDALRCNLGPHLKIKKCNETVLQKTFGKQTSLDMMAFSVKCI